MELSIFWNAFAAALGWTVFHSLWQISLLYLLYRLAARIWHRHSQALYLLALLAMAGSALWAAVSFANSWEQYAEALQWQLHPAPALAAPVEMLPQAPVLPNPSAARPWYQKMDTVYESWAAPIGWLWCLGALLLALRLLGGYWLSRRIRREGVRPVSQEWATQCRQWSSALGIRQSVHWLESKRVHEPLTLGFWKPVVLFPVGLLLQLSPGQVEALMLHELAHIRRHDYLINLFQLALEVCFFYHPLFWRLSKEARRQREFCCDELVLRYQPDRLLYAKALTQLQLSTITLNPFAMYAIGKSAFAQRILRIVNLQPEKAQRSPGFILFFLLLLLSTALSWSAFTTAPQSKPSEIPLILPNPSLSKAPVKSPVNVSGKPGTVPNPEAQTVALPAGPDTLSPSIVAVDVNKMNVFYIGIDNPITVAVPGYDCSTLRVRLSGAGTLISQGNCQYIAQVSQPGTVQIEIFTGEKGQEKQLGVKSFRVKRIPDPVARFEGYSSNSIQRNEIRQVLNRQLQAALDYFEFDASCRVVGFTVAFQPGAEKGTMVEFGVDGNKIPADRLDALCQTAGAAIYILDIKTQCPGDAAPRRLGDLVFKIRE